MSGYNGNFNTKLIYVMEINDDKHKGLLKIGEATVDGSIGYDQLFPNCKTLNDAAKKRIREYTNTAGIDFNLLHTELAIRMISKNNRDVRIEAFKDDDVNTLLKKSGYPSVKIGNTTGDEWFRVTLDQAREAIKAYKRGDKNLSNALFPDDDFKPIEFRAEQVDAIDKTMKVFKTKDTMLWNAKMRFGKTVTALEVVRRMKFKKTIIVTHRPVVDSGWYDDFKKIFHGDSTYKYGSKNTGYTVKELNEQNSNYVYFASIQDLRGSKAVGKKYDKNDDIFNTLWDFVIVDEAHEGTQTALGDAVINKLVTPNKEHTAKFLALSGTAFSLIHNYEGDNIYTWDYIMEQMAKQEWDKTHPAGHNPYEGLPSMEIRTYDLNELLADAYEDVEDKSFNFREFFRVWTGDKKHDKREMPPSTEIGSFIHEKDVKKFLDLLTTEDDSNDYPFANEEYRKLFQHSFWILPGVKEAAALAVLMKKHSVFGTGNFKIVNVAGAGGFDDDVSGEEDLKKVRAAIDGCGENQYTITLSCGKLTQGVTVPEWTAALMLAGAYSTSATRYLQTIFRVQSQYTNKKGQIKAKCYVFDFAPDRALKMMAEAAAISGKPGKTKAEDRESLNQLLNFCPVIAMKGGRMQKLDTNKLLQQLKRAYAERAVEHGFDDANLYNDEMLKLDKMDIMEFEKLRSIIGTTKAMPKTRSIDVNKQGLTEEELAHPPERKPKRELTEEEKAQLEKWKEAQKMKNTAISILRGISIRMPLLIYGAEIDSKKEITLEQFPDLVDDTSWEEFMPKGVTKKLFKNYIKYYDEDVFIAAGKKIRAIALSADSLPPLDRVQKISRLFANFKNPDKETVLTPWRVVNMHMSDTLGGYDFFDKEHKEQIDTPRQVIHKGITEKTFGNVDALILEINSKTGLYPLYATYSIYATKCAKFKEDDLTDKVRQRIWDDTVRDNLYVICKTKMAKTITQRTLLGYRNTVKCNTHSFDDLVNMMQNKSEQMEKKITNPAFWGKKGSKMKFDAIIGNPPYQETDGSGASTDAAMPIYQKFVQGAKKINPDYFSLIMPSKWMIGGRGLDLFREEMINDTHIKTLYDYENASECFPGVHIDGGICYFLYSSGYSGLVDYHYKSISGNVTVSERTLKNDMSKFIVRDYKILPILNKISHVESFSTIVSSTKPFGIRKDLFNSPEKYPSSKISENSFKGSVHIYGVKGIKGGARRKDAYIANSMVTSNKEWIDSNKIFFTTSYSTDAVEPPQPIVGYPGDVCTETFLVIGPFSTRNEMNNCLAYMNTKFFKFLLFCGKGSMQVTKAVFSYVPLVDFSECWTDEKLYRQFKLDKTDIEQIELKIKSSSIDQNNNFTFGEGVFHTTRRGIVAKMKVTEDGKYIVLAGSEIDLDHPLDKHQGKANRMREDCLKGKGFKQEGKKYILQKDMVFDSASTASGFVLGGSTNGFEEWKDDDGRTLDEVERKKKY